ncbi:hypothetical protein JHW43_009614 [Diplocarpon mali]|nr:hypothetical protein JHW43_009614 [Diplocarpon mali]
MIFPDRGALALARRELSRTESHHGPRRRPYRTGHGTVYAYQTGAPPRPLLRVPIESRQGAVDRGYIPCPAGDRGSHWDRTRWVRAIGGDQSGALPVGGRGRGGWGQGPGPGSGAPARPRPRPPSRAPTGTGTGTGTGARPSSPRPSDSAGGVRGRSTATGPRARSRVPRPSIPRPWWRGDAPEARPGETDDREPAFSPSRAPAPRDLSCRMGCDLLSSPSSPLSRAARPSTLRGGGETRLDAMAVVLRSAGAKSPGASPMPQSHVRVEVALARRRRDAPGPVTGGGSWRFAPRRLSGESRGPFPLGDSRLLASNDATDSTDSAATRTGQPCRRTGRRASKSAPIGTGDLYRRDVWEVRPGCRGSVEKVPSLEARFMCVRTLSRTGAPPIHRTMPDCAARTDNVPATRAIPPVPGGPRNEESPWPAERAEAAREAEARIQREMPELGERTKSTSSHRRDDAARGHGASDLNLGPRTTAGLDPPPAGLDWAGLTTSHVPSPIDVPRSRHPQHEPPRNLVVEVPHTDWRWGERDGPSSSDHPDPRSQIPNPRSMPPQLGQDYLARSDVGRTKSPDAGNLVQTAGKPPSPQISGFPRTPSRPPPLTSDRPGSRARVPRIRHLPRSNGQGSPRSSPGDDVPSPPPGERIAAPLMGSPDLRLLVNSSWDASQTAALDFHVPCHMQSKQHNPLNGTSRVKRRRSHVPILSGSARVPAASPFLPNSCSHATDEQHGSD